MKNNVAVLVVEDEAMLQDVYRLVLEAHGYSVTTANNGLEALEQLKLAQPNVILLDMLMPIMGGREFMRTIKLTDFPGTTIIAYSNLTDSTIEAEILELGASRFILKSSMTPDDLVGMIQSI